MHASEPRQLFQIIGLTACAVVGLPVLVDFAFQLPAELAKVFEKAKTLKQQGRPPQEIQDQPGSGESYWPRGVRGMKD